jgi:glutamate/aspartate transport system permease protein
VAAHQAAAREYSSGNARKQEKAVRLTPAPCGESFSIMSYHWNWGILFSPVSTGEPTTYLGWLISGFWVTIVVSLSAWVVAFVVGSFFGVLRTVPNRALATAGAIYVGIFRNIPLIVQFFIWYLVIPDLAPASIGLWYKQLPPEAQFYSSSIVCLGLFTGARVCEQVRSGIDTLPRGQRAAGLALGLTQWQMYRYVLLPVAYRVIVPPLTSEFLNIFKNSAVASTIGLLDLSAQARQLVDYTAQSYESFISVTLAYVLINLVVMALMRRVEARTRLPGYIGGK